MQQGHPSSDDSPNLLAAAGRWLEYLAACRPPAAPPDVGGLAQRVPAHARAASVMLQITVFQPSV